MVSIRRFGVIRTSNVAALVYFILTLIFVIPLALLLAAAPQIPVADGFGRTTNVNLGGSALFLLVLPFIYGIFGWILTAVGCLLYNLVAAVTGGIAVEVVREAPPAAAPALQGWGEPQP
jgi:glycopeptide antibiotics resistance protein